MEEPNISATWVKGGHSYVYALKNDGASNIVTDPWGRPFFKIRFRLTWFPRNTRKFHSLAMSLIVGRHFINVYIFIMSTVCQTVSYAELGLVSFAPGLSFF